jgi:hypothetical protein
MEGPRLVRARAIVIEAYGPVWKRVGRQSWHIDVATRDILAGRWDRTVEVQAALIALGESQAGTGPTCSPNSEAPAAVPAGESVTAAHSDLFARGAVTPETQHA